MKIENTSFFIIFFLLCFTFSCKTKIKKGRVTIEKNNIVLQKLYIALFLYYVDNKKLPSVKNGFLYGLVKTGKNAPYYDPFVDKDFKFHLVVRKNGKTLVHDISKILPRDKCLTPWGTEIKYQIYNKYSFTLNEKFPIILRDKYKKLNDNLICDNLYKLRYKKDPSCRIGADYIHKLGIANIKFYLDGEIKKNSIVLQKLYVALFIYYIDNKKFPSVKNGLLYGLVKTGKNAPYYNPFIDKAFIPNSVVRANEITLVHNTSKILPGSMYLTPWKTEIKYQFDNKTKLKLNGYTDIGFIKTYEKLNKNLLCKNLEKLRYKKNPNCKVGSDYIHKLGIFNIKFYLEETNKEKN